MNWIYGSIYLIFMFILYNFIGKKLLNIVGYENSNYGKNTIAGFLCIYFFFFIIGFLCQTLHTSWKNFVLLIYLSILLVVIFYLIKNKKKIAGILVKKIENKQDIKKRLYKNIKEILKQMKNYLTKYWLIYLLAIIFMIFYMANLMPYYRHNYDDIYYISKMTKEVGVQHLATHNYYNGAELTNVGFNIVRTCNTFEIAYAFLATTFHITIPFFARVIMSFHNYIIMFLAYYTLSCEYMKSKYAIYSIVFFCIFFISAGYSNVDLNIKIYDGWQFQTAMFYGGSVVRMTSIPIILLFGKDLIEKIELKKFLFMAMVFCTFISFSTIFFQIAIFMGVLFVLVKSVNTILFKKGKIYKILSVFVFISMLAIVWIINNIFRFVPSLYTLEYVNNVETYYAFFSNDILKDVFLSIGIYVFIIAFLTGIKEKFYKVLLIPFGMFIIFYYGFLQQFIHLTSMNYYFVSLRTIASIEYFIVYLFGFIICYWINKFQFKPFILGIGSILIIFNTLYYIYNNINDITQYSFLASGMIKNGYDFEKIFYDQYAVPPIFEEVGDYFSLIERDKEYRLFLKPTILYNNQILLTNGIIMSSRNIQISENNGFGNISDKEYEKLIDFTSGKLEYKKIKDIVKNYNIEYCLIDNEMVLTINNELKPVETYYDNIGKEFYLIKF